MEGQKTKVLYIRLQNRGRSDLAVETISAKIDPRSSHRLLSPPASISWLPPRTAASPSSMSASTSNLLPKRDTPAHKSVADFVSQSAPNTRFTLEGEPDGDVARLCRVTPPANAGPRGYAGQGAAGVPLQPPREGDCVAVAMEVKDLFATMQGLGFFCQLPQDPKAPPHIRCERIPQ